jgi:hypothetical protein
MNISDEIDHVGGLIYGTRPEKLFIKNKSETIFVKDGVPTHPGKASPVDIKRQTGISIIARTFIGSNLNTLARRNF